MKPSFLILLASLLALPSLGGDPPVRPRIFGIAGLLFYSTQIPVAHAYYSQILDPSTPCNMCETRNLGHFSVECSSGQFVSFLKPAGDPPSNLLGQIVLSTGNLKAMRAYLESRGIPVDPRPYVSRDSFAVTDPEGHGILFVKPPKPAHVTGPGDTLKPLRIIHAGFSVKGRETEEHFYRDILGFRPYWHGGMNEDRDDWVSLQVPDGTDWLEFMLNVPADADQKLRGIMNHFAIGVTDIHATQKKLLENDIKLNEEPKIGRDGKWQLNVYDPDFTRIEFMEFTPVQKPCCSEFTGPHPKP